MKALAYTFFALSAAFLAVSGWAMLTEQGLFGLSTWHLVVYANLAASAASITGTLLHFSWRRKRQVATLEISNDLRARDQVNGIWVLIVTSAFALGGGIGLYSNDQFSIWTLLLVLLLAGGAIALARFVQRHGDEIGEARFDTRNPDER